MDDSPWDDNAGEGALREAEWAKMSKEFTTAGYREGISAGKEAALQEGFDEGFALMGVPQGRKLGIARGRAAALVGILGRGGSEEGKKRACLVLDELRGVDVTQTERVDELVRRVEGIMAELK